MLFFFKNTPKKVYLLGMLISLIPILIMGIAQITTSPTHTFNWEMQYDQFYYAAHAREQFENGNGLVHSNPFDCREDSPVIYSHLFPLMVGYLWKISKIPIMFTYLPIRIVFGMLLTIVVWHLASLFFHNERVATISFYCLMIGGGGISTWLGLMPLVTGKIAFTQFFQNLSYIEGMAGWWFLNIFRNFFYATETLYHFLFFLTLLLVLKKWWRLSLLSLALMLYAHPYTGFQLGLVYVSYFFLSYFLEQDGKKKYLLFGVYASFLMFVFLLYNIVWLRSFSQHRELMNELTGVEYAVLGFRKSIICWGIWLVFGLYAAVRYFKPIISSTEWRLILILLAVSFILVNHHYLIPYRVQPAHFSHGYVFTPLVMLTFYLYEQVIHKRSTFTTLLRNPLFISTFILITALDNACFLPRMYAMAKQPPATITKAEKDSIHFLSAQKRGHVIATTNMSIGYLTTVFTEHDAVIGYLHHTPKSDLKRSLLLDLILKGDETLLREYRNIDMLILSPSERESISRYSFFVKWKELFHNEAFYIYLAK